MVCQIEPACKLLQGGGGGGGGAEGGRVLLSAKSLTELETTVPARP